MSVTRQLVFAIDPYSLPVDRNEPVFLTSSFSWAVVADGNENEDCITCAYTPETKKSGISLLQETMFFGTLNADTTAQTFRNDLLTDNDETITASFITKRLDPSVAQRIDPRQSQANFSDRKRFLGIEFPGVNPLVKGVDLEYTVEAQDPHLVTPTWESLIWESGTSRAAIPEGLGRWIHFKGEDTTSERGVVFDGFSLNYYLLDGGD